MVVGEGGEGVDVLDLVGAKTTAVTEVKRADVVLDGLDELIPVVGGRFGAGPAELGGVVVHGVADVGGIVHQLLGDTANVDTCRIEVNVRNG
jgi:hypothetical protein